MSKQDDSTLADLEKINESIERKFPILKKQVELLGIAEEALKKRDAINKLLNKAASLQMDDDLLTKAVGVNFAQLTKARNGFEATAMKALTTSRSLDAELED